MDFKVYSLSDRSGKRLFSMLVVVAFVISGLAFLVNGSHAGASAPGQQTAGLSKLGIAADGHQSISNSAPGGFTQIGLLPATDTIQISFFVPFNNMQEITSLAQEVSTPGSTSFHKFMTPAQLVSRFSNTVAFNSLVGYLSASGFDVLSTSMDSTVIATGTVAQVNQYLGLQVGLYSNGNATYYAAYGSTSLPGVVVYASNFISLYLSTPPTLVTQNTLAGLQKSVKIEQAPPLALGQYLPTVLQTVYNATGMYANGINGRGENVGILDFFGDPYIQNQLAYFDQITGLPAPPAFKVVPIGAYQPGLGISMGWADEISLDVESAHSMAPGANITLYIANQNLPFEAILGPIVAADVVQTLSQSFSIPESVFSAAPSFAVISNVYIPELYYQLAAIEGISVMASTGDVGGSGFSGGPLGTPGYPSTSAFVTAVGGTTTYVDYNSQGSVSSYSETAWSNYGMVPAEINYGGSTGGVSTIFPRPWYQSSIQSPSGFAVHGRMVPDISLNAALFPGAVFVLPGNVQEIIGGTSEASPLLAGLITLVDQYAHGDVGLLNPELYSIGTNSVLYPKVFHPITYGYNIPWTAHYGYNLITGFGSINVGSFASNLVASEKTVTPELTVSIVTENSLPIPSSPVPEYLNGSVIVVNATISNPIGLIISSGIFNAYLVSLFGVETSVSLSFNATYGTWMGNLTLPVTDTAYGGLADVVVNGSSAGVFGQSFSTVYVGYYVYFSIYSGITSVEPYSLSSGVVGNPVLTLLNGTGVNFVNAQAAITFYSILNNTYYSTPTSHFQLSNLNLGGELFTDFVGNFPLGPALVYVNGTGTFLPIFNGATLFGSVILGSTQTQPGAVAPGQTIYVSPAVTAPFNLQDFNVVVGSIVNISLVSSTGTVVSQTWTLPYTAVDLAVPAGTAPGLYTVFVNSSYDSYFYGYINGSYYGQIYVSSATSSVKATIPSSPILEGQDLQVNATITNSAGQQITYGVYSIVIYPANLQADSASVSLFEDLPLNYNTTAGEWQATLIMPSGNNSGSLTGLISGLPDYSGQYFMNIFGISSTGIPTTVSSSSGTSINLQSPYMVSLQSSVTKISSEIATITSEIGNVPANTNLTAEISSLMSQLSALSSEATYINQTFHINTTALQTQITNEQTQLTNLSHQLGTTTSTANTAKSSTNMDLMIGIAGAVLGAVGILVGLVALMRKPKNPGKQG